MKIRMPVDPTRHHLERYEDDERRTRRREKRKTKATAGGSAARKSPDGTITMGSQIPIHYEVIALRDDASINPRLQPHRFFAHPHSARERSRQRAIRDWMADACLTWGDQTRAPEATHYTLTDACIARALRENFDISEARGLRLVLTGRDRNVIKTGYWLDAPTRLRAA